MLSASIPKYDPDNDGRGREVRGKDELLELL
jgi:hypothetical protein